MQGKHLTQKERFYIEKRHIEGINQVTIARELALLAQLSAENSDAISTILSMVSTAVEGLTLWPGDAVISLCQKNAFHQLELHIQDFIRQELSTYSSPEIISGRLHL